MKTLQKKQANLVAFDKKKAGEYWDKAKKELGSIHWNLNLMASDTDSSKKVIEYIQNVIQENLPGVTVKPTPVPFSVRLDRSSSGDFDAVLGGWSADYADPSSFTDLFVTGNSYNRGQWSNDEYDAAVKFSSNNKMLAIQMHVGKICKKQIKSLPTTWALSQSTKKQKVI
jgi:oligopeptide transport system substrate-binding protein